MFSMLNRVLAKFKSQAVRRIRHDAEPPRAVLQKILAARDQVRTGGIQLVFAHGFNEPKIASRRFPHGAIVWDKWQEWSETLWISLRRLSFPGFRRYKSVSGCFRATFIIGYPPPSGGGFLLRYLGVCHCCRGLPSLAGNYRCKKANRSLA
jgi:hypothetical protein